MESWAIAELAVTCSSLLQYGDLTTILPAIQAFDRVRAISDDELVALWPLVVLRAAALMVSGQQQARIDPDNEYAVKNLDREWRIFEQATSVPLDVMTALVRSSVRPRGEQPVAAGHPLLHSDSRPVRLDLSTTSAELHGGVFLDEKAEALVAAKSLAGAEAAVAYVPFLQPRLTRTRLNSFDPPGHRRTRSRAVHHDAARTPRAVGCRHRAAQRSPAAIHAADGLTLWLSGPDLATRAGRRSRSRRT